MKCKLKIGKLYLKDFEFDLKGKNMIKMIQLSTTDYYHCESGEEAMFLKSVIVDELKIPAEIITGYAIEEKTDVIPGQTSISDFS